MTDELTKLIEEAPYIRKGKFSAFMILSNGIYDGFWGVNGYDNILILARPYKEDKWYILATEADNFSVYDFREHYSAFNLDIPTEYGIPRIWFDQPVEIDYSLPLSNVVGSVNKEGTNEDI